MTRSAVVSIAGLVALAVAMGIGRFAFTPILPMMQVDRGLTLAEAGWLASANYAGYLVGALLAMRLHLRSEIAIAAGLFAIGVCTAAAAIAPGMASLVLLRFVPGVASALVLIHVSAWSLEILAAEGRPRLGGIVFAGVGVGIALAGLACLELTRTASSSATAWWLMGICALVAAAGLLPVLRAAHAATGPQPVGNIADRGIVRHWRLVYAHGAFGFGYIIPATFLPVMAKTAISDPVAFGWAWPVFGLAAAASTVVSARLNARWHARRIWAAGLFVMAAGVASPILIPGLAGIIVAALAVGGTFMVVTMVGVQEARRAARSRGRVLIAAMTSAFALGQIAGPLLVGALMHVQGGFSIALATAAAPLLLATYFLERT